MTEINQGEVSFDLAGERVTLRSTLRAAKTVSASLDGFVGAYQRIAKADIGAIAAIIAAGLGKRTNAEIEAVEEKVYATGMTSLSAPVTRYVTLLANGGRDPAETAEASSFEGNG